MPFPPGTPALLGIEEFRDQDRQKFNESYMKLLTQFARFSDVFKKNEEIKNEFEILFYYDKTFMDQIVDPSFKCQLQRYQFVRGIFLETVQSNQMSHKVLMQVITEHSSSLRDEQFMNKEIVQFIHQVSGAYEQKEQSLKYLKSMS